MNSPPPNYGGGQQMDQSWGGAPSYGDGGGRQMGYGMDGGGAHFNGMGPPGYSGGFPPNGGHNGNPMMMGEQPYGGYQSFGDMDGDGQSFGGALQNFKSGFMESMNPGLDMEGVKDVFKMPSKADFEDRIGGMKELTASHNGMGGVLITLGVLIVIGMGLLIYWIDGMTFESILITRASSGSH